MRVVAGTARGRRLVAPDGADTRPTADRVREAVFNTLYSLGGIEDARVLDLFAGTGAMGIEALSRGAAHVVFVERSRPAVDALRENLRTADVEDRAEVVVSDVGRFLAFSSDSFDLVIIDPPYEFADWSDVLGRLHAALVVIESDRAVEVPLGWETHRVRRYGGTVVTIASPDRPLADNAGSSSL
jgi:16S rRNA (guanine966-N2)-methyltransferase